MNKEIFRQRCEQLIGPMRRPALLFENSPSESETSYLYGLPPAHEGFEWPRRNGRPLDFLACIDLSTFTGVFDWLPPLGRLLFFYDVEEQPWGAQPKDRDSFKVLFVDESRLQNETVRWPDRTTENLVAAQVPVRIHERLVPPDWREPMVQLALFGRPSDDFCELNENADEAAVFYEWRDGIHESEYPRHQFGGFPRLVQNPCMDIQCEMVTGGVDLFELEEDDEDDEYPREKTDEEFELEERASDWRLLLQLVTDDEGHQFGDMGAIYFWVRAEQARQGNFSDAWLILQC